MTAKKRTTRKKASSLKSPKKAGAITLSPVIYYGLFAFFLLLFGFIRLNYLEIPFERDEGDYCLAGQLTLAGETPYIDFYEQKPPGLFYSYALIISLAGKTLTGVHFAFILINLLTAILLFFSGRNLIDHKTGLVAAITFIILSLNPSVSGFTAQSEHLLALFMSGGLLAMISGLKLERPWLLFAAGALVCWSMLIKQHGIFFTTFLGIMLVLHHFFNKSKPRQYLIDIGYYGAGVLSILLLMSIVMVAQGSFQEMIFWIWEYPSESYVNAIPFEKGMEYFEFWLKKNLAYYWPFWFLGTAGLIMVWFTDLSRYVKWTLLTFFIISFLSIVPGYRFYPHYWIHFLPGVALAAGGAIYSLAFLLGKIKGFRIAAPLAVGFFILLGLLNIQALNVYYFNPSLDNVVRSTYGSNPFSETKKLSEFIRRRSNPDDQMVVVGSEPQMHFYTQLMSPSKHTFMAFLMANHPRQSTWREELKQDIQTEKPRYMVVVLHPFSWAMPPDADQSILEWLIDYAKAYYTPVAHVNLDTAGKPGYYWEKDAVNPANKGSKYITVYERR